MGKRFQRAYIHVILEFLTRFFPFTKMTFSSAIETAVQCHCLMMSAKTRHIKHDRSIFQKTYAIFGESLFLYMASPLSCQSHRSEGVVDLFWNQP